jgi:hypothetical protein
MKKIYALLLATAIVAPTLSAQQTHILTADKHNEYGLVYTLPQTGICIDVTATRTVRLAGDYYQYAKKFVGADNVIKENSESWTINNVKVSMYGTPMTGEENQYLMQLKAGALTSMCVADDGMLLAINTEVTAPTLPDLPEDRTVTAPDMKEYLKYVNEDFLASQSSAKRAQMLSESLMEIRDSKVSLTRGTAETMPTDGRQLELMLNSLAHQEESIMTAFTGTEYTETYTRRYYYMPTEGGGRNVLFRMSSFAGFVAADDYAGDPVYINIDVTRRGKLPVDAKGEEKKWPKDGIAYNIPGAAKVKISYSGTTLYENETEFAQYGVQFGLNPSLFSDKKERSFATFNPATGALLKLGTVDGQ